MCIYKLYFYIIIINRTTFEWGILYTYKKRMQANAKEHISYEYIVFVVSFYSRCLDCFPYSAVLFFTEVSWLFSPSPSPQSSHAGSVLCLTRLAGRPFSPAASADVSVTASMEMRFTFYFSFSLLTEEGCTFSLHTFLSWFI